MRNCERVLDIARPEADSAGRGLGEGYGGGDFLGVLSWDPRDGLRRCFTSCVFAPVSFVFFHRFLLLLRRHTTPVAILTQVFCGRCRFSMRDAAMKRGRHASAGLEVSRIWRDDAERSAREEGSQALFDELVRLKQRGRK